MRDQRERMRETDENREGGVSRMNSRKKKKRDSQTLRRVPYTFAFVI